MEGMAMNDDKMEVKESHIYSYEEAVEKFGNGRYQLILFLLLVITTWSTTAGNDTYVWIGATMAHTCLTPNSSNITSDPVIEYIPSADQCSYRTLVSYSNGTNSTLSTRCTHWSYDTTFFTSTVMSEWDLNACNGKWKISLLASLYMIGFLVGCIAFGALSDRFGRRLMFLISHIGLVGSGIAAAYSTSLPMLIAMRFFFGIFVAGARNCGFVYLAEILTPKWRAWTGPCTSLSYWMFTVTLTTIAMFTGDWRKIQLIASLVCIWFIPYYFYMYESPFWLLAQGRKEEVIQYFKRSAQVNKVELPEDFEICHQVKDASAERVTPLDFVRAKNIRLITLIVSLAWFCVAAVAFGFTFNVGNMTGNIFINMYIVMAGGIFNLASIWIIKFGRRLLITIGFYSAAALAAILAILVSYKHLDDVSQIVVPIFSGAGRVLASFCFSGLYVITPEIYATKLRVTSLGMGSSFARLGGALAPYLALSSDISPNLPYILFSAIAVSAGSICLCLPETLDVTLPESVQEMESYSHASLPCRRQRKIGVAPQL